MVVKEADGYPLTENKSGDLPFDGNIALRMA
jgi:hypothetical protein